MSNVTAIRNMQAAMSYLPDGVAAVLEGLIRYMPPDIKFADNLNLYTHSAISTTKAEIDDDAGSKPIVVLVKSAGTKTYVHFHNADADSVTAGVDVDWMAVCSSTSGEVAGYLMTGASWDRFWDTGLTISASTTSETSSAPANPPAVWVIYAGS